jgi:hypothetical protein
LPEYRKENKKFEFEDDMPPGLVADRRKVLLLFFLNCFSFGSKMTFSLRNRQEKYCLF